MENIFPQLGEWNITVENILKEEYPPKEDSSLEEIERYKKLNLQNINVWELICTEAIDTEYPNIYYQKVYEAILKRGFSEEEIKISRKFTWLTAGWLNFSKMAWDWTNLDKNDIKLAIKMQYEEKLIDKNQKEAMEKYIAYIEEKDLVNNGENINDFAET
jgi:hypothetical protein